MPKYNIPHLPVPDMTFVHGGQEVTRPITDHHPMLQNTAWGTIATLNLLNPGSRSPLFQTSGVRNLPKDGKIQMEAMAKYIYEMIGSGVEILVLQEVPPPKSKAFKVLIENLTALDKKHGFIDVTALKSQWLQTGKHTFGTSILYDPSKFTVTTQKPIPAIATRAAIYQLSALKDENRLIPIANIHGDHSKPEATIDFIRNFDGICLGDLSISEEGLSDLLVTDDNETALLSIKTPKLTIGSTVISMETADCILDNYSRTIYPEFIPEVARLVVKGGQNILDNFASYLNEKVPLQGIKLNTSKNLGDFSEIIITDEEIFQEYQQFTNQFETEKGLIQDEFIKKLLDLKHTIYNSKGSFSEVGLECYNSLFRVQNRFFENLSPGSSAKHINDDINEFRKFCENNVKIADKLMGHGWLYRAVEVLIKAVIGLFAGIGMILGVVIGQGVAKAEHRQGYKNTFFTWNKTKENKALDKFKDEVLGKDDEDQGLLDKDNMTPKKNI